MAPWARVVVSASSHVEAGSPSGRSRRPLGSAGGRVDRTSRCVPAGAILRGSRRSVQVDASRRDATMPYRRRSRRRVLHQCSPPPSTSITVRSVPVIARTSTSSNCRSAARRPPWPVTAVRRCHVYSSSTVVHPHTLPGRWRRSQSSRAASSRSRRSARMSTSTSSTPPVRNGSRPTA
jgi:hypothetical protein